MKRTLPSLRTALLALAAVFFLALLLTHSRVAMDGARRGLSLCAETLLPSLFPFLVLSQLMTVLGVGELLGRVIGRPVKALFGLSDRGAAAFLLGAVCGFPVGTTTAVSYCEQGELSEKELERVSLFCNNPSSGFLIAATGEGLFGNRRVGIALFAITLISAVTVGLFLRICFGKTAEINRILTNGAKKRLSPSDFTNSVIRAGNSFLTVCALVIFFSCISECLSYIFERSNLPTAACVLLGGALEMTSGIGCALAKLPVATAFLFTAFFASFSGFSVCLQILSCAAGHTLRISRYLAAKLLQGLFSLLFGVLYLRLFSPSLTVTESVLNTFRPSGDAHSPDISVGVTYENAVSSEWHFFLFFALLLFLFVLFLFQKIKKRL